MLNTRVLQQEIDRLRRICQAPVESLPAPVASAYGGPSLVGSTLPAPSVLNTRPAQQPSPGAPDYGERFQHGQDTMALTKSDLTHEDEALRLRVSQLEAALQGALGTLERCAGELERLQDRAEGQFEAPQAASGSVPPREPLAREQLRRAWEARRVQLETDSGRRAVLEARALQDEADAFCAQYELHKAALQSNARTFRERGRDLERRQEALGRALEGDIAALKQI